jgi:hypothetical protein
MPREHLSDSDAKLKRSFKTEQQSADRRAQSKDVLLRSEQLMKRIGENLNSDQADKA